MIITWGDFCSSGGYLHRVAQDKKGVAVRKCFMAFKAEEHSVLELHEETALTAAPNSHRPFISSRTP